MKIVFATTCKGRVQHLKATLRKNLEDNPFAKFVVLDYGSEDELASWIMDSFRREIHESRLVVYAYPGAGRFRMAHAKNMAHRCAIAEGADVIVNLDADNFAGLDFERYASYAFVDAQSDRALWGTPSIFFWARMLPGRLRRGISGRIAMTSKDFLLTGGYDECYEDWGPDDKDMNARLQLLGRVPIEIPFFFLDAVHHKDKLRFKEYPHARPEPGSSAEQFCAPHGVVANWGNFGCGVVYKNYGLEPTILNPLPTRIFGIGNQKTATQALDQALTLLGYKSAHWLSGHWARQIMVEMTTRGQCEAADRYFALSDLPVTFLYKELDRGYPGSKFILTTRPDAEWLESARKHFSYEHNVFRKDWDKWPASNQIHKAMYGRTTFDAEVFLTRYKRHNAEVKQYFRGRPNDLLVLEMEKGNLWEKLCRFLEKPIPAGPYPFVDATLPKGGNDREARLDP